MCVKKNSYCPLLDVKCFKKAHQDEMRSLFNVYDKIKRLILYRVVYKKTKGNLYSCMCILFLCSALSYSIKKWQRECMRE